MRPLALALLLLACTPAAELHAQFWGFDLPRPGRSLSTEPPPAESHVPHPSIVRVVVDERTSLSHGSGALVAVHDQYGLVLTNWHVVRDVAGPINVIFPSGFMSPARIVKTDQDWDLAALGIWNPNTRPIPVAASPPRVGDTLTIAGYGPGQYRAVTGRCTQFLSPGRRFPYEMIEVSVEARRGDSGGPILNQNGEVAGILFGASRGATSGSHAGRLRRFLAPWIQIVDAPPTASAGQQLAASPSGAPQVYSDTSDPQTPRSPAPFAAQTTLLAPQPGAASGQPLGASGPLDDSPFAAPATSASLAPPIPPPVDHRIDPNPAQLAPVPIAGSSLAADRFNSLHPAGPAQSNLPAPFQSPADPAASPPAPAAPFGAPVDLSPPKPAAAKTSPFEHARNALAIVGVVAVLFHLFRKKSED